MLAPREDIQAVRLRSSRQHSLDTIHVRIDIQYQTWECSIITVKSELRM
jgi:hypothetical protein